MGIFKEKGVDIIDYILLKKKGILKDKEETSNAPLPSAHASQNQFANNPFGFLDNASTPSATPSSSDADLSALKLKIEDVEYKIERLLERLAKIEENFGKG